MLYSLPIHTMTQNSFFQDLVWSKIQHLPELLCLTQTIHLAAIPNSATPLIMHLKYITQCWQLSQWSTGTWLQCSQALTGCLTWQRRKTNPLNHSLSWTMSSEPYSRQCSPQFQNFPLITTTSERTKASQFSKNSEHRMELAWGGKKCSRTVGTFSHFLLCSLAAADSSLI